MSTLWDVKFGLVDLNNQSFTARELSDKITDILLNAVDKYNVPEGIDSVHVFDIMNALGWIKREGALYLVKIT